MADPLKNLTRNDPQIKFVMDLWTKGACTTGEALDACMSILFDKKEALGDMGITDKEVLFVIYNDMFQKRAEAFI